MWWNCWSFEMTITTDKWSDQIENTIATTTKCIHQHKATTKMLKQQNNTKPIANNKNRFSYMSQLNAKSILMSHKVNE